MYDKKDFKRLGCHDYNKESAEKYALFNGKSFSVNIFKWVEKSSKKEIKPSKCIVRVSGKPENKQKVFKICDIICKQLDAGEYDGNKNVKIS